MIPGEHLVYATARVAMALYFGSLLLRFVAADPQRRASWSRGLWTLGWLVYLAHLAAAFQFVHHWSHAEAAASTTRRTAELTGRQTSAGIYFNYLFTLVWTLDVAWWRLDARGYAARPRAVTLVVHAFMAFMVFNAVVVFASGPTRLVGLTATAILGLAILRRR